MADEAVITQVGVRALKLPSPDAIITQVGVRALTLPENEVRVTQVGVRVLRQNITSTPRNPAIVWFG